MNVFKIIETWNAAFPKNNLYFQADIAKIDLTEAQSDFMQILMKYN
jgi:hypothetical protein